MSTDLHDRPRQPSPDDGPTPPEKPKSSLSIAQIVGGALAAMTAAALGSRLSLAGTVLGAAFASVIAALAGALYTASLRRTTRGVSTVIARVRPGTAGSPPAPPAAAPPTTSDPSTAPDGWATADLAAQRGEVGATAATTSDAAPRRLVGWKQVVLGALLMFVVAALVLTGIELATGRALSGGNGTTVSQVADPGTRPTPAPTRSASPSATPTRSATPSASAAPTASPSAVPSSAPSSAAPTPSATAAPSSTPTAAPSATPSPSASGPAVSAPAATPGS